MVHNSSGIFQLTHYILLTKRVHLQCRIFLTLECSNESLLNSPCHFWSHKVRVYSNFTALFSVMKDNSPVFFLAQTSYVGQKEPIELKFSDFWVVGWKFTKSYKCETTSQFQLCITLKSQVYSSVLFKLKLYMIWTKGTHQSAKFQNFDCSCQISSNLYFDRLLLLKVYKVSAKKVQRSLSHDNEEWCKIWRKTDLLFDKFSPEQLGSVKIGALMESFCPK